MVTSYAGYKVRFTLFLARIEVGCCVLVRGRMGLYLKAFYCAPCVALLIAAFEGFAFVIILFTFTEGDDNFDVATVY